MSDFMFEVWAHSCVSKKKLETALQVRDSGSIQIRPGSIHGFRQDPTVTAIEVDVAMGYFTGLQVVTALQLSTHRLKTIVLWIIAPY